MANKILHSNSISFVDTTDARKLEVFIASTLPTVQVYNSNTNTYSPDWSNSNNNLRLSAEVYLDSQVVTSNSNTIVKWYEQIGAGTEKFAGDGTVLTIKSNKMSGDIAIITYTCKVKYNDNRDSSPVAQAKITFTRTDTGLNGTDGNSAPAVLAQYSVNNASPWTETLNSSIHKYIRFSYDGGSNWSTGIKIAGEDGKSVSIKGTATSVTPVDGTDYYTLVYETATITGSSAGDSYLYNGYLYVYASSKDGEDYFVNVGEIQGPQGNDGESSYLFVRYATDTNGSGFSEDSNGKTYIGTCVSHSNNVPTDMSYATWKWRKFVGNDAYTLVLTNENHTFAGDVSNALASYTDTQVLAYKGGSAHNVTISTINGKPASTSATATGISGLTFKCSALSGAAPTITFTCTTALTQATGIIPIVIVVDGISFTKMFTYSIAFKGASSTSYWLVSNASAVQKTSNGDVIFTPSTLTFTGKSKLGSNTPVDYAGRWVIDYTTDGITYANLYTSTTNEASKTVSPLDTYKAIRARMYLAGGTTTLLDEQIIPFVSDGAIGPTGAPGDAAVTFQVYSSNGYALSTNTPVITLQTFAYIGDVEITSGASYQWYSYDNGWTAISGATLSYIDISRDSVSFSRSYMCKMTFGGVEYTGVATIDDKNDENKVFTSKPFNYIAGDLWIVGTDYIPGGMELGTLLKTEHTNSTYADSDWVVATKYDEQISSLKSDIDEYNQYFSFDSQTGLRISARDANGNASQFSTTLSNERLSFNQGTEAVAYIESNKMKIKEAEIISPLTVTGYYSGGNMLQAPVINIGSFSIIVEDNGSLSIVVNT